MLRVWCDREDCVLNVVADGGRRACIAEELELHDWPVVVSGMRMRRLECRQYEKRGE